jgi:rhamnosyl/mannosyltransferase
MTESLKSKSDELITKFGSNFVLFVGRLIYYKGIEYLVRAMTDMQADLVIVGTGTLEAEMKMLAQELGISQRVHFAGKVADDDLPAYFHACKLLCLPSIERSEAFGIVQLEAHACGKPTVCTSLPTGVQFANLDGITGLVVPPRDISALTAAINKILSDDALRIKFGTQARERVLREFTRKRMADDYLRIYKVVLESAEHRA